MRNPPLSADWSRLGFPETGPERRGGMREMDFHSEDTAAEGININGLLSPPLLG